MAERILVERMGEHHRASHLCPLCPSYDRWAIPVSWVHSPPNWEEEESGVQLVSSIWNSSTWSPVGNFLWGLIPSEEGTSSWISPEIWEVLEIKSVGARGSQTLSLLWRIIEGPACRLGKNNKLNFQSSELVLVFTKLLSTYQDNVFLKLLYIAVELINNIVLVSGVQQSDLHVAILFQILSPL